MKKYIFIGLGTIIICVIVYLAMVMLQQGAESSKLTPYTAGSDAQGAQQAPDLKPSDISIGIFSATEEPTAETKLLEKRLQELGFKVSIIQNNDADADARPATTIWHKTSAQAALDVLHRLVLATTVVRELPDDTVGQDIVFAAWNMSDIIWGPLVNDALKLTTGNPASVKILVLNAGAASGEAGRIVDILKAKGYELATAASADVEIAGDPIVYYQRNFKDYAKNIMYSLRSNGYPTATYRAQFAQEAGVVVMLMKTASTTEAVAP